jgi:hypothetical protein
MGSIFLNKIPYKRFMNTYPVGIQVFAFDPKSALIYDFAKTIQIQDNIGISAQFPLQENKRSQTNGMFLKH